MKLLPPINAIPNPLESAERTCMPNTIYELTKMVADLKKKVTKLEKEIKTHQRFIDKVSLILIISNPLFFASLSRYRSQKKKARSSSTKKTHRLMGKKK